MRLLAHILRHFKRPIHVVPNDVIQFLEPEPVQVKTLFVSAGHSDVDPGATGHGYTEADIVLEFRDLVAVELRELGVAFNKDGERGQNLPLRVAISAAKNHDVAVEWHCNAFSNPAATGVETLCADPTNSLSNALCDTTATVLGIRNRGAKAEASGQHSRLGFVSTGGGVIHELFFITNPADLAAYHANKRQLAYEVAKVLADEVRA